jgi:hypothetical protein
VLLLDVPPSILLLYELDVPEAFALGISIVNRSVSVQFSSPNPVLLLTVEPSDVALVA